MEKKIKNHEKRGVLQYETPYEHVRPWKV